MSTSLSTYFDGSWFDISSLAVASIYAFVRWLKQKPRPKFLSKATGADIANGVGLFPLLVLSLASFSTPALMELVKSNRLILSVAGFVALLALLDE